MKSIRKAFYLLPLLVVTLCVAVFAACNKGKTYTLSLDLDGGTLSVSSLELEEGANISDAVKDLVPQKSGLTFGAWFDGNAELASDKTMPAAPMTLTAKYKVGYTVEVYLGNATVPDAERSYTGSDYVGAAVAATPPAITGYVYDATRAGTVASLPALSATASENVMKLYYSASSSSAVLLYEGNAPDASATVQGSVSPTYPDAGGKMTVAENGFSVEGYRFLGWSASPGGSVVYHPGDVISDSSMHILYAKWQQGYMDRFGSTSYIFVPEGQEGVVLLRRGMKEFEGTMSGDSITFTLPNESKLEGKIFEEDYTYAFKNPDLAHTYIYKSTYLNPETGSCDYPAVTTDTLVVDEYGTATRSYRDEKNAAHTDKGVVMLLGAAVDIDGEVSSSEYLFLCTDNENNSFTFQTSTSGSQYYYASSIGEGNRYSEFLTGDGSSGNLGQGGLMLDGYGNITFYDIFEGHYYVDKGYELSALTGETIIAYKVYAVLTDMLNQARDLLGYDVDEDGHFVMRFYTLPFDAETSVYIEPKPEGGTYKLEGSENVTLELDGNRAFPDSAIYTDPAHTENSKQGYYYIDASPRGEFFAVCTFRTGETGASETVLRYKIDLTNKTFTVAEEASHVEYVQLSPISQNFDYAMTLALYDTDVTVSGVTGAKKAELLLQDEKDPLNYTVGADGCYTETALQGGGVTLSTFVATQIKVTEGDVPSKITFMLSSAYDSSYFTRELYYVFEFTYGTGNSARTEKNYTEITDVNKKTDTGDASAPKNTIWFVELPVSGIGTLYFDENGNATLGSFSIDRSGLRTRSIFGTYGYFLYVKGTGSNQSVEELCFEITTDGSGAHTYYELLEEEEYAVFEYEGLGSLDTTAHLVLRGNEAYWSENGFEEAQDDKVLCTLVADGTAASGATVYNLVPEEGATAPSGMPAKIALREIDYYDVVEWVRVTVFTRYNASFDKTYTAGSDTLKTDGFCSATYTNARGPVSGEYSIDEDALVFEAEDGSHLYFSLDGTAFELLDGIVGTFPIFLEGEWLNLQFDGRSNIIVKDTSSAGRTIGDGRYNVLDVETREVEMFLSIDEGDYITYVAAYSYGEGALVVCDENARGVFVGADWSVLYLDGFDSGTYYAADGSAGVTVYYDVVDADDGFISLRTEDFEYLNFKLDGENHTLTRPQTYSTQRSFYDSNFRPLIFDNGGYLYYADEDADRNGYYYIDGNNLVLYVDAGDADTGSYEKITAAAPAAGTDCVVEKNTYYAWTAGTSVTFNGTVTIQNGGANTEYTLSLTFTPDGEPRFYANATLKIDNTPYNGYQVVNSYVDGSGTRHGLALYNPVIYEYSPFVTYTYNPKGSSTITVAGGTVETKMYDGFENDLPEAQRSFIVENYIGFGPIRINATTASGTLHMGSETMTFTNAKIEEVLYSDASMGPRYSAIFTYNNKQYTVQYHKYDGDYWLYMVATYEKVSANNGYEVGIASFYYADEGYTFPNWVKKGTPYAYTLYKTVGEDKEVVYAYNALVNADGTSGWVLELGDYDVAEDRGNLGKLYEIKVTAGDTKTATVTEHEVKQALGTFENAACFANFFVDHNGDATTVSLAALALTDSDGDYAFVAIKSIDVVSKNVWKVTAQDGTIYTVSLLTEQDGSYTTTQGEYWQINVRRGS